MTKHPSPPLVTKKHVARAERERMLRNRILIVVGVVLVASIALVVFGFIQDRVLAPNEAVAFINGEEIPAWVFEGRVRSAQVNLLSQVQSLSQSYETLEEGSELRPFYEQQIQNLTDQLTDPLMIANNIMNELLDEYLVRQEAQRRGILVTEEEVDRTIAELFGFFPEGTPTLPPPTPTATMDPAGVVLDPAMDQLTETPRAATPDSTATPRPTATPFTREAYEEQYSVYVDRLAEVELEERDFLLQIEMGLYRERLMEVLEAEVPRFQDQVRARHILAEDEETAQQVLDLLDQGETWESLALEFSQDQSNKEQGGELGWFGLGQMVEPFEEAAFGAEVGTVVGPVETNFGWHVIEVLEREERELTDAYYRQAVAQALTEWLEIQREEAEITFTDGWTRRIPPLPAF